MGAGTDTQKFAPQRRTNLFRYLLDVVRFQFVKAFFIAHCLGRDFHSCVWNKNLSVHYRDVFTIGLQVWLSRPTYKQKTKQLCLFPYTLNAEQMTFNGDLWMYVRLLW